MIKLLKKPVLITSGMCLAYQLEQTQNRNKENGSTLSNTIFGWVKPFTLSGCKQYWILL
jgi:hypothetical protein